MDKMVQNIIQSLNLMAEAIPDHLDMLSSVGINEAVQMELKTLKQELEQIDSQQEKLKSKLKTKTQELEQKQKAATTRYSELKKLIKIKLDQSSWRAFGIEDKR